MRQKDPHRFGTTTLRLLAHCITHHDADVARIHTILQQVGYLTSWADWDEIGLTDAVRSRQEDLAQDLVQRMLDPTDQPGDAYALNLIAASIDEEHLRSIWNTAWEPAFATQHPEWLNVLLGTVLHRRILLNQALDRITKDPLATYDVCDAYLINRIIHAPPLSEHRDALLDHLLDNRGAAAAKHIVHAIHAFQKDIQQPPALVRATRMLVEQEPESPEVEKGIGACLRVDPDFAMPIAAKWINDPKRRLGLSSRLAALIHRADQPRLMGAIADDALTYPDIYYEILASGVHLRRIDSTAVCDWIEANLERDKARFFIAGLLRKYLSSPSKREVTDRMVAQAERLHERHGLRSRQRVLERNHLNQDGVSPHLRAVALAQDVRRPRDPPDLDKVLTHIRALPSTFRALGGDRFEPWLRMNAEDFDLLHIYEDDLDAEWERNEQDWKDGKINETWYHMSRHRLAWAHWFRMTWEERFGRILTRGHNPSPRRLRTNHQDYLPELMLLDRLQQQFDQVILEPRGMAETKGKNLDYLLRCVDGELFLELAVIGEKPDDVREGSRHGLGGEGVKKTLQNKLGRQFHGGNVDLERPLVLAVQVRDPWDLDFGVDNALYGPQKFTLHTNTETGDVVGEGMTRDVGRAFFQQDGVECISAVAVFEAESMSQTHLAGRLCKPLHDPAHPLPLKLWVRLRMALYGPEPSDLESTLGAIPTITQDEARALWDVGVDDVSFLAAGYYEKPADLGMADERFTELQREAVRLIAVHRHQQIHLLVAAEGLDLQPFYDAGIHTLPQLVEADERPEEIDEKSWVAMQAEARRLRGRTEAPEPGVTA